MTITKIQPETPIPWEIDLAQGEAWIYHRSRDGIATLIAPGVSEKNALYLVNAANSYPALLTCIKELQERVTLLEADVVHYKSYADLWWEE